MLEIGPHLQEVMLVALPVVGVLVLAVFGLGVLWFVWR